ncbi:putative divalent heavy-metal cation transporter [Candidatus Kinetoplastibacterium desouzaii TCC079E]|uniref:Putative divalent heavy-metal cation transporter n=1 Tax=Candidatus Kinetoplastidibacterium desouzai TCC079E TaxID=1208919 RepID=M1LMK2_9PROT|nr:ZIP family metal transporter [Candidatus Kinetoplastibacterium desouzaii]AGF46957.1 putative divalent heavy-metal cation transporter [Candidatus Kinetoplastibacterium desouzaii TCC079E]
MIIFYILVSTLSSGLIAVCIANWLTYSVFSRYMHNMISLSVGIFLSVSFLHLLPEAYEHLDNNADIIFKVMLISIICFVILEKVSLLRHNHHYEGDGHGHSHGHDKSEAGSGGIIILIGSSLHNFSDGILISAAFLTYPLLGVLTSLSIAVHEIPHKLCDFVVLRNSGLNRSTSLMMILISSLFSSIGGLIGYFILQSVQQLTPFALVIAASSFIYIAIADLIPQMHEYKKTFNKHLIQLLFIFMGIFIIYNLTNISHHYHCKSHDYQEIQY